MTNILYRTLTADSVATGASGNNFLGEDKVWPLFWELIGYALTAVSTNLDCLAAGCAILLNFQMHKNVFEALGTATV